MTPEQQQALVFARQLVEADERLREKALRDARIAEADATDSALTKTGKTIGAIGRGTGEGFASTADLAPQAGEWAGEVIKNAWEESQGRPYTRKPVTAAPFTEAYNKVAPAVPEGYENINDWSAVVGPAAIQSIATLGAGAPASIVQMTAKQMAKEALKGTIKVAGKTALDVGSGIVGNKAGQAMADLTGSPEVGNLAGMLAGATTSAGTRFAAPAASRIVTKPITDNWATGIVGGAGALGANLISGLASGGPVLPNVSTMMAGAIPLAYRAAVNSVPNLRQTLGRGPTREAAALSAVGGANAAQNLQERPQLLPEGHLPFLKNLGVY